MKQLKEIVLLIILLYLPQGMTLFADSRLIKNLDIWDVYTYNFNASHWIEQGNLQNGVSIYGEVNIPITKLPVFLRGADFLQTSVSSNNYSGDVIARFTVGENATLFIAHSVLINEKPKWMRDYQSTGQYVKTASGDFEVFSKQVRRSDEISLGSNGSADYPMYFVALQAQNKIENRPPKGRVFDVKEFGAIGDNKTINTRQIQSAIDRCSSTRGGGIVYIHDGIYVSGTLEMKDNVTLYIENGAILRGSMNPDDYPQKISHTIPSFRSGEHYQLIFADSKQNIRITGGGIIDGNSIFEGFPWRGKGNEDERPRLIRMIKCADVSVDSISLIRGANWTQYYEACSNLYLINQNIRCYTGTHNQDGTDISGCKNVVVRGIRALAGDDVICIKSLSMEIGENILVEDVTSRYANCHLVKVGTETHGGVKNLTVRNVEGFARYGIAIESVDGATVENILYENILLRGCATPLFIRLGSRGRTFQGGPNPAPQGTMKNITIRNVRNTGIGYVEVRNGPGVGSAIGGVPNQKIENLTIEDCDFLYYGSIMDKEYIYRDIPENIDKYPEFNIYGTCPAYGLYFRHIEGLTLRNVNVSVKHTDIRPGIVFEDATDINTSKVNVQRFPFTEPAPIWNKSETSNQSPVAQTYTLTCNDHQIPVMQQNDVPMSYNLNSYQYAQLVYEGTPMNISVNVKGYHVLENDWEISPKSRNIQGKLENNTLRFTINEPGYFVIRFAKNQDFTKRLVLLVDKPYKIPDGEMIDITKKYHVDNTGNKNETVRIQKALNDISGKNATLYFPQGIYSTSMLRIHSDSKIHFEKGAILLASTESLEPYLDMDGGGSNRFIYIRDAKNIHITGLGGFDGNGTYFRAVKYPNGSDGKEAMRLLFIVNSRNITFDGILLKDASRWNTHIVGSSDISFRYCKMLNNPNTNAHLTNFDGWDPDASQRVLIENCFGWAGDDNIAIKCVGTGSPKVIKDVKDITIRNNVFLTKKSSLKIGTETRCGSIKNIVFENNDVIESDRAMAIDVQDRAVINGVLFKNNRIEYNYPDAQKRGINVNLSKRDATQNHIGKILNVRFEDCNFEQMFPNGFRLFRDPNFTTASDMDVTFINVKVGDKLVTSVADTYFDDKTNSTIKFE